MQTGACVLDHAGRSMPTELCDQKGEGHEYGSMQTGAIYFQKKIMRFDFLNLHRIVNREIIICLIIC